MRRLNILIFLLFTLVCPAYGVDFFLWKQFPDSVPTIMAKKDHQTEEEAIEEYFKKINAINALKPLLEKDDILDLRNEKGEIQYSLGEFSTFEKKQNSTIFIVVTNELRELYSGPFNWRIKNVQKKLHKNNAQMIALPPMHDLILNAKEGREYREKLYDIFDAQLVLGGDDIDPLLYGEEKTFAKDPIRMRDVSELKFVKGYIKKKKGISFGLCRGHQMCAIANGKKLYQDIQIEKNAPKHHIEGNHLIEIDRESSLFNVFENDLLMVNSYHHQEIKITDEDPDYKITAKSLDENPVIEAIEFRDGMGVTLQFHPELMHDEVGDKVIERFVSLARKTMAQNESCFFKVDLFR